MKVLYAVTSLALVILSASLVGCASAPPARSSTAAAPAVVPIHDSIIRARDTACGIGTTPTRRGCAGE